MHKVGLQKVPCGAEAAHDEGPLPLAYEDLDQSFCALLEDEALEDIFEEFRANVAWPE